MTNVTSIDSQDQQIQKNLAASKKSYEKEKSKPVDPESLFEANTNGAKSENSSEGPKQSAGDESGKGEEENKIDIINTTPLEFMALYDQLTADEVSNLINTYKEVSDTRDEMTLKMKMLADWCEEKNVHFPTFKNAYKRAHKPKKKQNMIDATFAWFARKFQAGYQKGLWD